MKTFVLDTNVILHDASSIFKFGENDVVIPAIVLEELDKKKRQMDEVGRNAREFSRIYMKLRREHKDLLSKGVPLETGGTFRIELNHKHYQSIEQEFGEMTNDNKILAVATNLSKENPNEEFTLVSNDTLMIAKADTIKQSLGLENFDADVYENDRLVENLEYIHKGYHEISVPDELIGILYDKGEIEFAKVEEYLTKANKGETFINDFFIVRGVMNHNSSFVGRLVQDKDSGKKKIRKLWKQTEEHIKGITARNVQQKMLLELLLDREINLITAIGKAGTGKTLLALVAGLYLTEKDNSYKKMLVGRPIMPMGKDIGYLPGEKEEKLRPWMQPIYDNIEFIFDVNSNGKSKENIDALVSNMPNLQIEALTYIRGRSIPDQFIIIDEAQNLTPHEVKTIITRAGEGTKIILLGDPEQIDHPYLDAVNNGLTFVTERMKQESYVGVVTLKKSERSKLAERASDLLK